MEKSSFFWIQQTLIYGPQKNQLNIQSVKSSFETVPLGIQSCFYAKVNCFFDKQTLKFPNLVSSNFGNFNRLFWSILNGSQSYKWISQTHWSKRLDKYYSNWNKFI